MIAFATQLIEALRSLLPSPNDNNKTWLLKVSIVMLIVAMCATAGYHVLINTTLGERYGIKLNPRLATLTHMELVITRRQVRQLLGTLKVDNEDVRSVVLFMLIDKKTRNMVLTDNLQSTETDLAAWEFEIPVQQLGAGVVVVEDVVNEMQGDLEAALRKNERCITIQLEGDRLADLKRGIPGFVSTHAAFCPVYTFYKPRLLGMTMVMFRVRPPLDVWFYQERLRLVNDQVERFFTDVTQHYEILYE